MALPKRWEPYSPVGKRVEGTRFISFKVPLNEKLLQRLPEELRFSPDMLVDTLKERGERLAVVIDLTNTYRYYNREEFVKHGINHEKILVEGKRIPSSKVVNSFYAAVEKTLKETYNEETLIGVHCTHGVNRTGYLICRYMVEKMEMEADKAIEAFTSARGHPIERENFLEDLRLRQNGGAGLPDDQAFSDQRTQDFKDRFRGPPQRFHNGNRGFHDRFSHRGDRFSNGGGGFPDRENLYQPDERFNRRPERFDRRNERFHPGCDMSHQNAQYNRDYNERNSWRGDWGHRPDYRGGDSWGRRSYDQPRQYGRQYEPPYDDRYNHYNSQRQYSYEH